MNLFDIFQKGGVIMWLILFCSIIGLTIVIDRFIVLRKAKINVPAFMVRLRGLIKKKDINGAVSVCMQEKSPLANIVRKGLKKYRYGHDRVKEAIENAGKQEIGKLEKGLPLLATIAGVAPLIGFLGTVTGRCGKSGRPCRGNMGSFNNNCIRFDCWNSCTCIL